MNKKKITKYLFLIILTFLANITLFNSYAQEINSILTFEEALETSIRNSSDLKKLSNQNRRAQERGQSLSYDLQFYNPVYDVFGQEFAFFASQAKTIDFEKQLVERNRIIIVENLKLQLKSIFNNIEKINREISLLEKKIEREFEKQKLESIKKELGMVSKFDIISAENRLNNIIKSKDEKLQELNKSYFDLSKILNRDVPNTQKIESLDFEFDILRHDARQIDFIARNAVENNILVWSKEKEIDFKRLEMNLFAITIPSFSSGATLGNEPYKIKEIDKSILENDLSQIRANARNAVKEKHNAIKNIETNISILIQQKDSLLSEIEMMRTRASFGLITQETIKDMELQLKELEHIIYELKRQHEYIKYLYLNPFLSSM